MLRTVMSDSIGAVGTGYSRSKFGSLQTSSSLGVSLMPPKVGGVNCTGDLNICEMVKMNNSTATLPRTLTGLDKAMACGEETTSIAKPCLFTRCFVAHRPNSFLYQKCNRLDLNFHSLDNS